MGAGKVKKLLATVIAAVMAVTGVVTADLTVRADSCGGLEEVDVYTPSDEEVIKDPILHWAVRSALNAIKDRPVLTQEMVKNVKDLSYEQCSHAEDFKDWKVDYWIKSLEGIQYATSARMVDICYSNIAGGKIESLEPLSALTQLRLLYLKQDGLSDISALSSLVNLEELNLYGNKEIDDISAVSDMKKLKKLTVEQNVIEDIGAVAGLESLEYLNIAENKVNSLPDMSGLKNLSYLDANNNRLTDS